jgi:Uncharacterized conserved protein
MRRSMLDILACPIDKYYPLELFEIDTTNDSTINDTVISEGILFCSQCSRFYPIIERFPLCCQMTFVTKIKILNFYKNGEKKFQAKSQKMGNHGICNGL